MRWVVFLRAANVGKHNRFQPAALAKKLAKFGIVNIGAVGTFVVREKMPEAALRKELQRELPFKCEMMICSAKAIVDLAKEDPFEGERGNDIEAHVSMMAKRPASVAKLPLYAPTKQDWEIKICRVVGTAVLSLRRIKEGGRFYANAIVEKEFGVAATTRNWNTIKKVRDLLAADQ